MKINAEVATTPPRNAATVVMLHDTPGGLEVFLVRRHGLSDVLGGAYVFPGGKLDDSDSQLDPQAHLDQAPEHLHSALGEPDTHVRTASGLYVAALREAFEESGVLFAHHANTAALADTGLAAQLQRDAMPFNQILTQMELRLQTQSILPWSRWITPVTPSVSSKRFDTRFFVAAIPENQVASHDNHETTDSAWLQPRTALEQYRDGQIELAPPQIMSLAHLARHNTVHGVMSAARATRPPVICPETYDDAGERVFCYPGDPLHSVLARALPGPTRLRYRNRRFEAMEGFEALFA
jgi:8-oxo-dGTP pyrophosphatase MutT (NUDIX family)